MSMPSVRALLFDFDGTLWDCESLVYQAYDEQFRRHGQRLPEARWPTLMGTVDPDPWGYLEELTGGPVDRVAARYAVEQRKTELLAAARPRPGVPCYLAAADVRRLPRGIVSNSRREWIDKYARQCGIDSGWRLIESADGQPRRAKPRPDLYLAAVARLGLRPEQVIAFEDSPAGVRAAKLAGLRCVAVTGPLTGGVEFAEADLRIDCFAQVGLPQVLATLTGAGH